MAFTTVSAPFGALTLNLKLADSSFEVWAIDPQAKALLELITPLNDQIDLARDLRRRKSDSLTIAEKMYMDETFLSTEAAVHQIATLVEPYQVTADSTQDRTIQQTRLVFTLADSPGIQTALNSIYTASQTMKTIVGTLSEKSSMNNAALLRNAPTKDGPPPPSYEESIAIDKAIRHSERSPSSIRVAIANEPLGGRSTNIAADESRFIEVGENHREGALLRHRKVTRQSGQDDTRSAITQKHGWTASLSRYPYRSYSPGHLSHPAGTSDRRSGGPAVEIANRSSELQRRISDIPSKTNPKVLGEAHVPDTSDTGDEAGSSGLDRLNGSASDGLAMQAFRSSLASSAVETPSTLNVLPKHEEILMAGPVSVKPITKRARPSVPWTSIPDPSLDGNLTMRRADLPSQLRAKQCLTKTIDQTAVLRRHSVTRRSSRDTAPEVSPKARPLDAHEYHPPLHNVADSPNITNLQDSHDVAVISPSQIANPSLESEFPEVAPSTVDKAAKAHSYFIEYMSHAAPEVVVHRSSEAAPKGFIPNVPANVPNSAPGQYDWSSAPQLATRASLPSHPSPASSQRWFAAFVEESEARTRSISSRTDVGSPSAANSWRSSVMSNASFQSLPYRTAAPGSPSARSSAVLSLDGASSSVNPLNGGRYARAASDVDSVRSLPLSLASTGDEAPTGRTRSQRWQEAQYGRFENL